MIDDNNTRKRKCFVIGPIGNDGSEIRNRADYLLECIIKPALTDLDYEVFRADEVDDPGTISDRLILDTINSDLVIVDLTNHNANAFYELGIRHTVGKPTIHMISHDEEPPFDVSDQRIIKYNLSNPKYLQAAQKELSQKVNAILEDDYQVQNPVTRARGYESISDTGDSRDVLILNLASRISKLEAEQRQTNIDLIRNEIRTDISSGSIVDDSISTSLGIIDKSKLDELVKPLGGIDVSSMGLQSNLHNIPNKKKK